MPTFSKPVVIDDLTFTQQHLQAIRDEASAIFQKTGCQDRDRNWKMALCAIRWRHFTIEDWRAQFAWDNSFDQWKEDFYFHQ